MTVEISSALLARLLDEAAASPDREVCGLLFGTTGRIEAVRACANMAADPARTFEVDPAALFAALREERAGGARLLGHYHSHPFGSAEPSAIDAANAAGDGALWLIVAGAEARLWRSGQARSLRPVELLVRTD